MNTYDPFADPVVQALLAEAEADPDVLGLILCGSLGAGAVHPESDYDAAFIVSDEAAARYKAAGNEPERGANAHTSKKKDLWHVSVSSYTPEAQVGWEIPGYGEGRVLLDKTGDVTRLHEAMRFKPEDQARAETAGAYDAYLNSLYRSLKAWRRGNDLGARMQAAEGAQFLLGLLFILERRWRPYNDRLWLNLDSLAGQGWQPGELRTILLDLLSTGDPTRQQHLARRVAALLRARGYGHVYDAWEGEIDDVLAWSFA